MTQPYLGLKVAGLAADFDACGHYRLIHPLERLEALGAKAQIFRVVSVDMLRDFDAVIFQRPSRPDVLKLLEILRREGKLVIVDTDDMLDNIHPSNPAYAVYAPGSEAHQCYLHAIALAHGITVTTQELADHYAPLNRNVKVVPNRIDLVDRTWPKHEHHDRERVRIGWTGSTSHMIDMPVMATALPFVMAKHEHVRYVHFGHPELLEQIVAHGVPRHRIELVEMRGFADYPGGLGSFDIGLAPLANNTFNQCKSPLKLMEYSACSIPFVASRVAPYARYARNGIDGFTADTRQDWVDAICKLVEDPGLRKSMGDAGRERIKFECSLENNIDTWVSAWNEIARAAIHGNVGPGDAVKTPKPGRNDPCPCGSGKKYKKCSCYPAWGA